MIEYNFIILYIRNQNVEFIYIENYIKIFINYKWITINLFCASLSFLFPLLLYTWDFISFIPLACFLTLWYFHHKIDEHIISHFMQFCERIRQAETRECNTTVLWSSI